MSTGAALSVEICEVGPRDGLQNEPALLSASVRADFVNRLADTGLARIEATSFVNPTRVPQMAGAEDVLAGVGELKSGAGLAALVLNWRGYERLSTTACREVRLAFCVTETFNQRNQGRSVERSLDEAAAVVSAAKEAGRRTSVTLSASFGCPFEGPVDPGHVLGLAEQVAATEPDEIIFADTIGVGVPRQVRQLLRGARHLGLPLGLHLHNTRNAGYANAYAALEEGVSALDSSLGGIGGCPFAPNATGNIATEDLLNLLEGEGIDCGVDLDALLKVTEWLTGILGQPLPGHLYRAGRYPFHPGEAPRESS